VRIAIMTSLFAGVSRVAPRITWAALVGVSVLAGCGTTEAADPLLPAPSGRIRVVDLITDTTRGRVTASIAGSVIGLNLTYGTTGPATLPTPSPQLYAPVVAGAQTLVLKRTVDTNTVVASLPFTVATGVDYTFYATGGAASSAIASFITADTNTTPAVGQARVRVVHLAPSAPSVDVFVTAVGADLALATPTLANVPLRGSAYLAVAPGTYQVRAVPAGTAAASRAASVAVNLASVVIPANGARTIVAADNNIGGAPFRFITLTDR
jgi:hypothetical protein